MPDLKHYKLLLPMLLLPVLANAQKLPNIQQTSLKKPANIKIDGKTSEWNGLQAYNHAIQASYTLANDDNKLYLIVSSNHKEVINKMIMGGVSLLINKNKKSSEGATAVTYPAYAADNSSDNARAINKAGGAEVGSAWSNLPMFVQENAPVINLNAIFYIKPGAANATKKMDSLVNVSNKTLSNKAKFIRLSGLQGNADTLISVYNKYGVKASSALSGDKTYTIEMAIDLKLLGLSTDDKTPFNYGIRFNEINVDYVPGVELTRDADGVIKDMKITDMKQANSFISALSNTDCWGAYTLTK